MARRAKRRLQFPFNKKLVLNQWLLSLFNVRCFKDLAEYVRDEDLEGLDENNIHRFYRALAARHRNHEQLHTDELLSYDQNIVKHTFWLNERRVIRGEKPIVWKYFQYLALLFTEIYLDRYFRDPVALLTALNTQVDVYNADRPIAERVTLFNEGADAWPQLNKIALWMATGSGKTLLMHVNILQYQNALVQYRRTRELNRILLLTPNEGLSQQHLREFETAGIWSELFRKDGGGLNPGEGVEILEVTRLREEMGDRTVAIDAFEGNNLVLVDEGHRGASSGEEGTWMRARNALCETGFSFEYSATFGQAVKGSPELTRTYAKSILYDYSYRYFYADGFGKDYQILNLEDETQQDHLDLYLVACLLCFFQQQRLYLEEGDTVRQFNIDKPLWIFVGGRVTATLAKKDASDIVEILHFLRRYVADHKRTIGLIERVLNQGLVTATGRDLFSERFPYLNTCKLSPEQIFSETLASIFNAPGGGNLYVENLQGATGEVALRLGAENAAFGVMNVGDDAKLVRLCGKEGFDTGEREFAQSLFHEINLPNSTVNLLIGSRKFTEGWNSWRVSTMGLMNIGRGEGAQIIQLFGRGVRLKGLDLSLKRTKRSPLVDDVPTPRHVGVLETLSIFGIHADYLAQFRDFLEEEDLPTNDDRIEFLLPVTNHLGTKKLKTIRLKKTIGGVSTETGNAFRELGPISTIVPPEPGTDPIAKYLQKNLIRLNWYPKVQAMRSTGLVDGDAMAALNETHLTVRHAAFFDLDRIYFDLERFKSERGWFNLNLTRQGIEALLADQSWYVLEIPEEVLVGNTFDKVRLWEEIAVALLKKYMERYYAFRRNEWELPHLEYRYIESDDPNFLGVKDSPDAGYRILVDRSQEEVLAKLKELKAIVEKGKLTSWEFQGLKAISFSKHLYQPLLYLDRNIVETIPAPLNTGERQFIEDLMSFHGGNPGFFENRELYLLRNLSRGRGIGFFEAGNYHPDFIVWLVSGRQQRVIFVDPKGIRNLGPSDPKIRFFETVKMIEQRLGDPAVRLDSFIVSNTSYATMRRLWDMKKSEMQKRHILFQDEDKDTYVEEMLNL